MGVAIGYPDGRLGACNNAYQKITGYSETELKNIDWNKVLTPPEWEESQNIKLQELHKTKKAVQYEKEYIKKDGSRVPIELLVYPQFDNEGNIESYLAFALDITERKLAENKFRELSSRNEAILISVPDIIMEVDNNKIYTWSNKAGYDFFGEDVIGKAAKYYFEGEQETYETVTPIFKGDRKNIYIESWQRRQDGKIRLLAWWCSTLKDKNGNVTGALSTARDITEEKEEHAALRNSQALYHDLVETSQDLIWQCDAEGKYTYLNPAWEEVFAYKTEEMLGRKFSDFQTPEYAERDLKEFEILLKGNTVQRFETVYIGKDGSEINLVFNAKFVLDNNGNIIGTRGTAYDITERKRAEKALLENEQNSRDLVENLLDGVAIVDENAKHIYVNPKFCEITGYSKEELLNMTGWDFTRPQDRAMLEQRMKDRIEGKLLQQSYDRIILKKDGTEVPVEMSTSVTIWQGKNRPMAIIHNLTQRKMAEKMLKERESRLQSIFGSAPIGIGVVSNRILMKVNARMTEIIGYSEDELIGQSSRILYPNEEEFEKVGKYKYDQIKKYGTGTVETRFLRKDGKLIDVILSSTPIDSDNLSTGVTFTVLDITGRKQAEIDLQKSFAKTKELEAIVNRSTTVAFLWRAEKDWPVEYVSENISQFGYTNEEFTSGKLLFPEIIYQDDLGQVIQEVNKLSQFDSNEFTQEYRIITKSGDIRYVDDRTWIRRDKDNKITHYQGILTDITERKEAEENLRASEAKNRAMIDAIPDLIFVLNQEGVFEDYKAPNDTSLFASADSFLGKNIREIMPQSIVESYITASEQAIQTGQSHLFEYSLDLPDGRHQYESHLVKYHHNFLSIVRDITERKLAEEKLKQQMNELNEFNKLMVGRENKMADLKIEINKLLERLGEAKKYKEN